MVSRSNQKSHTRPRPAGSRRGFTLPTWALGLIGLAFLGVAIFAGVILFRVVEDLVATGPFASAASPPAVHQEGVDNPISSQPGEETDPGESPEESEQVVMPAGIRPQDRVTILVLGTDQPCAQIEEPYRSDTMILLTIDPIGKTAGMLSVPRDLWVPIPGFSTNRINTAYRNGEIYEYPGGGPALAVQTVEYNLGVHIHHYVTINYDGFIEAVDLIGGIEIDVPETINDPKYPDRCYGYDPFYIEEGQHTLDGETTLKYARTRATFGADIDRAGRQQAVLMAAWDRVLEQNITLLGRAPELWQAFEDNVTTDMTYQEAVGLALLAMEIPTENIHKAVIDYNYVRDYTAPDGAQVLVPIREKIRDLRDEFFADSPAPVGDEDWGALMPGEAARVLLLNGTWTAGLAGDTATYLESLGFTIAGVDDADEKNQNATEIIDYRGKTATVNYLAEVMNVPSTNIFGGTDASEDYDVKIILGTDWEVPSSY